MCGVRCAAVEMVIRTLFVLAGVAMLGSVVYVVCVALRAKHVDEDWSLLTVYALFRAGTGAAAIWVGLGGGAPAFWTFAALLVGYVAWREITRRRLTL